MYRVLLVYYVESLVNLLSIRQFLYVCQVPDCIRYLDVSVFYCFFFFFQAEDGIRDVAVTGVQTCALPISTSPSSAATIRNTSPPRTSVAPCMTSRCCISACISSIIATWRRSRTPRRREIGRASCRERV